MEIRVADGTISSSSNIHS